MVIIPKLIWLPQKWSLIFSSYLLGIQSILRLRNILKHV